MNFEFLKFWKDTPALLPSVTVGRNFDSGIWNKIGSWSTIGDDVEFGLWTKIGSNTIIGHDVHLGNWVEIGNNVVIGDGCTLPDHVRVQDNSVVQSYTRFEGHELITPHTVILNRCGGSVMGTDTYDNGHPMVSVTTVSGKYIIPGGVYEADEMLDDYMNGTCYRIVKYKIG